MTHEGDTRELDGEGGRRLYLRVVEAVRLVLAEQLWPGTIIASYPLALEHAPVTEEAGAGRGCGG